MMILTRRGWWKKDEGAGQKRVPRTYIAAHVELSAARLAGSVQSNSLGPDEVIARGDVARDLEAVLAAVLVELVGAPGLGARVIAELGHLEPFGRGAVGRRGVVDLAHVDEDRAEVVPADGLVGARAVAGLRVHLDNELVASC